MSEEEYKNIAKYLKIGGIFLTILIAFACILKTIYETYDVYVTVEHTDQDMSDDVFSYMDHHR